MKLLNLRKVCGWWTEGSSGGGGWLVVGLSGSESNNNNIDVLENISCFYFVLLKKNLRVGKAGFVSCNGWILLFFFVFVSVSVGEKEEEESFQSVVVYIIEYIITKYCCCGCSCSVVVVNDECRLEFILKYEQIIGGCHSDYILLRMPSGV